jgi:hypothetical protein
VANGNHISETFDLARTRNAVQRNCDVSDATHARELSLCVYLLKMREMYRWEERLAMSDSLSREAVGDWVWTREALWDEIEGSAFASVPVGGESFDPFDVDPVNARLARQGLAYGAGIGRFGQPSFFLARLERVEHAGGIRVLVCAEELARDLAAPGAMLLGDRAFVRRESLRRQLWEAVDDWRWRRPPGPLAWLHEHYGFDADTDAALDRMADDEVGSAILHEQGEHRVREALGDGWTKAIARAAGGRDELVLRAVGDHLADTLVTLPAIIAREDGAALMRFASNLRGQRKVLAPALTARLAGWAAEPTWSGLDALVERAREHWRSVASNLAAAASAGGDTPLPPADALSFGE